MAKLNPTAIIVALIVIIGAIVGVVLLKSGSVSEQTVSASGNYQKAVAPDQVVIYVLVQTRDNISADNAKNENARISDNVMTALIKAGLEKKDIETENYNIYPEYDWSSGSQKLIDYVASNNLKVTTKDFANAGKIVDGAVNAGALINNINFELSNEKSNEYKAVALAEASKDAKVKAESIAAGLGKSLGKLVSVSANDYNYVPYPIYARSDMAGGAEATKVATDISPQNVDISASATVVYEIK
jgi:uncharacterized protein YggE